MRRLFAIAACIWSTTAQDDCYGYQRYDMQSLHGQIEGVVPFPLASDAAPRSDLLKTCYAWLIDPGQPLKQIEFNTSAFFFTGERPDMRLIEHASRQP
jgi:hypothetical protein